jgi:3-oxoacyl-[acyl-carrier protein] reductase
VGGAVRGVHYSATKNGVVGLTRSMALELAQYGIRVNAIAPGPIETDRTRATFESLRQSSEYSPHILVPMRRLGQPHEIADAALYLASDEASYVTGTTLPVAGGR